VSILQRPARRICASGGQVRRGRDQGRLSIDGRSGKSEALVDKHKLGFPVGYSADARAVSAATGAFVNENPLALQATGFVIDPEGRIVTAVYSTRAIGRLMPADVLNFVRHFKSLAGN
jgi:alkyl hydroperoxide reductase subunit AhpC